MVCDALICLWFVCHAALQAKWIRREANEIEKDFVQMTDFTVRVNKLPKVKQFAALPLLKAALTLHIEKIFKQEEAKPNAKSIANPQINSSEIVSVNFAMRPFSNYKVLLKIE